MTLTRRHLFATCLLLALVAPAALSPTHAYSAIDGWPSPTGWSSYGGSEWHAGRSPVYGPATDEDATAPRGFAAQSFGAPVVDGRGHVFGTDTDGRITKFGPDLEIVWRTGPLGGEFRSGALVGPDGTVYGAPVAKDMVAVEGGSGKVLWRHAIHNTADAGTYVVTGAPAYHPDGFVVQGSMNGKVYALDAADGAKRWTFGTHGDLDNKVVATPAINDDGIIFVGSQNGRLYALDPDGNEVARFRTDELVSEAAPEEQQVAAPTLDGDSFVYVTTRLKDGSAGKVYALAFDGEGFTKRWSRQLDEKITAPVTIDRRGDVYVGTLAGTFWKLDGASGKPLWSFYPPDDDPNPSLAVRLAQQTGRILAVAELAVADASDRIYVPFWIVDISQGFPPEDSLSSPLYALDTEDGSVVWSRTFDKTMRSPAIMPTTSVVAGNRAGILYTAGDDGVMYGLGTVDPDPHRLTRQDDAGAAAGEGDDGDDATVNDDDGDAGSGDADQGPVTGNDAGGDDPDNRSVTDGDPPDAEASPGPSVVGALVVLAAVTWRVRARPRRRA